MKEFFFVIADPHGIHARPAGKIAETARRFASNITFFKDEKQADAKRLLALMSLGAIQGSRITVTLEGSDEVAAADAMERLVDTLLGREACR